MNIYEKLQKVRAELHKSSLKKSGKNAFAKYEYFELGDFLPTINQLLADNKLVSVFEFGPESARLRIINAEKPEEEIAFPTPVIMAELKGATDIQALGATQTYIRRYLYVMAFEIAEHDTVDAVTGKEEDKQDLTPEAAGQVVIGFGKHKGKTVAEIFEKHQDYVDWFLQNGTDQKIKQAFVLYAESIDKSDMQADTNAKIDKVKVATIEAMLKKTGTDKKAFLDYYELDSLENMTNTVFIKAMKALEKKPSKDEPQLDI